VNGRRSALKVNSLKRSVMKPTTDAFFPRTHPILGTMRSMLLCLGIFAWFARSVHSATFTFDVDADQIPSTIASTGSGIEVTWPNWLDGRQGRLEHADSLTGPWQSVSRSSPYPSDPSLPPRQFYRVRARPVTLHIPENYDPQTGIPLVLLLHAYLGTPQGVSDDYPAGQVAEDRLRLLPLSESHGFLYAFPDGLLDSANTQFWAANDDCCDFHGIGADDHDFLEHVIEVIRSAYHVDSKRIYLVGWSNGGVMAYEFAARHSELIAAVVALAPALTVNALSTPPAQPVNILHIQGTDDPLVPYEGGINTINFPIGPITLDYLGAQNTIDLWAQFNSCSSLFSDSEPTLDLDGRISGIETSVSRYQTFPPGGAVELWTIDGGDHFFRDATTEFREQMIEWLLQHPKP